MKTKKTIIGFTITLSLIALMCLYYYQAISNTMELIETEIKLTYNINRLEHHKALYYEYQDIVRELHNTRGQLDNERKDLASVYMDSKESIAGNYIKFETID